MAVKKKHSVKANLQIFNLSKAGTSLELEVFGAEDQNQTAQVASGLMNWPSGDKSETQKWRLLLSVVVEGSQEWTHEVDAEWERRSNIIRLGMGTRTDADPELPSPAHEKRSV